MARPPWFAEHRIDADRATALVRRRFGLAGRAEPLGEGWDSVAYRIGDAVFRFPKRDDVVPHLRTELRVLPVLRDRLPLAIPEPRWIGEPDDDHPLPFAGYPYLAGVPAGSLRLDPALVLDAVQPFLDALHALPAEGPLAEVRGWPDAPVPDLPHPVARRARGWLERHPLEEVPPVLLHGDLGLDHVLVDPITGRVTGIVDWGDLDRGDPARDLAGLVAWAPEAVAARWPATVVRRAWAHRVRYGLEDCVAIARWRADEADAAWARLAATLDLADETTR